MSLTNILVGGKQLLSMGALPYFAGVAVAVFIAGGVGAWKVKGKIDDGRVARAEANLSKFEATLALSNAKTEADAAARQKANDDAEAGRNRAISEQMARIPSQTAEQLKPVIQSLRAAINDPRYDCLNLALPNDYLRLLSRPGGTIEDH